MHEQPEPEAAVSSDVIYVILSFWLTRILGHETPVRTLQARLAMKFPEVVVQDDRAGNG